MTRLLIVVAALVALAFAASVASAGTCTSCNHGPVLAHKLAMVPLFTDVAPQPTRAPIRKVAAVAVAPVKAVLERKPARRLVKRVLQRIFRRAR